MKSESRFVAMHDAPVDEQPVAAVVTRTPGFTGHESAIHPLAELGQRMRPQCGARISSITLLYWYDINAESDRIRVGSAPVVERLHSNPFNADSITSIALF
ncbi:hypothetical protein ABT404_11510 [Streptomyces hyaluromycini]|uniref:Uncharacterized protein n=1 Tax=Streptomyces hyaluromycini TaxID=1377993 RepID=A0ABV1WTK4_9ACTN